MLISCGLFCLNPLIIIRRRLNDIFPQEFTSVGCATGISNCGLPIVGSRLSTGNCCGNGQNKLVYYGRVLLYQGVWFVLQPVNYNLKAWARNIAYDTINYHCSNTVPFRPTVQSRVTICSELNTSGVSSRVTGYREQLPKQINRKYDFALILSAHSSTI